MIKRFISVILITAVCLMLTTASVIAEELPYQGGTGNGDTTADSDWQFIESYCTRLNWFLETYGGEKQLSVCYDVCYGNGVFVCIGLAYDDIQNKSLPAVAVSENGFTWQVYFADALVNVRKIDFDGKQFIAYTNYGDDTNPPIYAVSSDGINWDVHITPGKELGVFLGQRVTIMAGNAYVAVSKFPYPNRDNYDKSVIYKQNGEDWTEVYSEPNCYIEDMKCLEGELFAVGTNGFVATSTDGDNWNKVTSFTTDRKLRSVAKIDGQIAIFGNEEKLRCDDLTLTRSPDGQWKTWDINSELYQGTIKITPYGLFRHNFNGTAQISSGLGLEWTKLPGSSHVVAFATNGEVVVEMTDYSLLTGRRKDGFSVYSYLTDKNGSLICGMTDAETAISSSFVYNPANLECTVIAAVYDQSGKLIATQVDKKEDWQQDFVAAFKFENYSRLNTVKVLYWDSINTMQPIEISNRNNNLAGIF